MGYLCIPFILFAQQTTIIQGQVLIKESNEAAEGFTVSVKELQKGALTNSYGFFSFKVTKQQQYNLTVSYVGHILWEKKVEFDEINRLKIYVPYNFKLDEVVVTTESLTSMDATNAPGKVSIPISKLKQMPIMFGDADVVKAMQFLPGVNAGSEGSSGLSVRGGDLDQNLFLLDGAPVYNPSHVMGFYSIVNGNAVKSLSVFKASAPARYGGKMASTLDVKLREGNAQKFEAKAQLGAILSNLVFEGPILNNKMSFLISARKSHFDFVGKELLGDALENENKDVGFGDITTKVNYKLSTNDQLYLSAYYSKDRTVLNEEDYLTTTIENLYLDGVKSVNTDYLNWKNKVASFRWAHIFKNEWFSQMLLSYSQYEYNKKDYLKFSVVDDENPSNNQKYKVGSSATNRIKDIGLKYIIESPHYLRLKSNYGIELSNKYYSPEFLTYHILENDKINKGQQISTVEVFTEQKYKLLNKLEMNVGLRAGGYFNNSYTKPLFSPRFQLTHTISNSYLWYVGIEKNQQYTHQLSLSLIESPTDLRLPADEGLEIQDGTQLFIGNKFNLLGLSFGIDGYYKWFNNQYALDMGAALQDLLDNNWRNYLVKGSGKAIGVEFFIEKSIGKLNGWISYAYSRSIREYDHLSNYSYVPFKYDRPHILKTVLSYDILKNITVNMNYTYQSGAVGTVATNRYVNIYTNFLFYYGIDSPINSYLVDAGGSMTRVAYLEYLFNNYRQKDYSRLDVSIYSKINKNVDLSIGVYNVLDTFNEYSLELLSGDDRLGNKRIDYKKKALYGIMPYVNVSVKL